MKCQHQNILNSLELEEYHQNGFVVPRYRLTSTLLSQLQVLANQLVADNPTLIDSHMIGPHIPGSGTQNLKSTPGWMEIARHSDILNMIEQILGPNIILWNSGLFYKRPVEGPATPFHRDANNAPIEPLVTTSVWISVFESTIDNGCLKFLNGSHLNKIPGKHELIECDDYHVPDTLDPSEYDEGKVTNAVLEPGQMVLFDIFTVHGTSYNRGKYPRAGYAIRFMPSTSVFAHDKAVMRNVKGYSHHTRPLTLVRGTDLSGRNDFRRGHPSW